MSLRRAGLLALPLLVVACTDVTQKPLPPDLVFAAFASPNIPTPSDLALASTVVRLPIPTAAGCATPVDLCALPVPTGYEIALSTQVELLCALRAAGGFPSDQESAIAIPITAQRWDGSIATEDFPNGAYVQVAAPALDLTTVTTDTVAVYRVDGTVTRVPVEVDTDPLKTYAGGPCTGSGADTVCKAGQLTLRKVPDANGRRWTPGARYAFALRGGARGVQTAIGLPLSQPSAIAFVIPNLDLNKKENQPLGAIPDASPDGSCGFRTSADEVGLLEAVRKALWQPNTWSNGAAGWSQAQTPTAGLTAAFPAIDAAFPLEEAASVAAFGAAPAASVVVTDSGSGVLPFPSDFLLTSAGTVRDLGNLCGGRFDPAGSGSCTLSRAVSSLTGFSTTAPLTFNTSAPVKAGALPANSVLVFDLGNPAAPKLLKDARAGVFPADYVGAPTGTTVALAPGIPFPPGASPATFLPPLKSGTRYAVVITDKLLDAGDQPFTAGTLSRILWQFTGPIAVDTDPDPAVTTWKSQISSVPDGDAGALQTLRNGLNGLITALPVFTGGAITRANVVMAYTVLTQPTAAATADLASIPYKLELGAAPPKVIFSPPVAPAVINPATAFGVPAAAFPNVAQFLAATVNTFDAIDPASGAFFADLGALADPSKWDTDRITTRVKQLTATVAVPAGCSVATPCAAPLVVFHHGINGHRNQVLGLVDSLAARGFVVASIDMPYHGSRAFCDDDTDCRTAGGGVGTCTASPTTPGAPAACAAGETTNLSASGNYFISSNFFRTRDGIRQDSIDHAALILALARPGAVLPQPPANPVSIALAAQGVTIDPAKIYLAGLSLGGIISTQIAATNPRISRAVLNVPGGTLTDVFTNSPAFQPNVAALFSGLLNDALVATGHTDGGTPPKGVFTFSLVNSGNPACTASVRDNCFEAVVAGAYNQTLAIAKWILDPADPLNFARDVITKKADATIAPLLGSLGLGFATTDAFGQLIVGDAVVPTVFGRNLMAATLNTGGTTPVGPIPFTTYTSATFSSADPLLGSRAHGLLGDALCALTATCGPTGTTDSVPKGTQERDDLAQFLLDLTTPPAEVALP